jgi:hypothetical protein
MFMAWLSNMGAMNVHGASWLVLWHVASQSASCFCLRDTMLPKDTWYLRISLLWSAGLRVLCLVVATAAAAAGCGSSGSSSGGRRWQQWQQRWRWRLVSVCKTKLGFMGLTKPTHCT